MIHHPLVIELVYDPKKAALINYRKGYWETLSWLWQDTENMHENQAGWKKLWMKRTPGKEHVMDEGERDKLLTLPETFWIWRGGNRPETSDDCKGGMCWTLDKNKALWFSNRYKRAGWKSFLIRAEVSKKNVLAYFEGRNEQEIVAWKVKSQKVTWSYEYHYKPS